MNTGIKLSDTDYRNILQQTIENQQKEIEQLKEQNNSLIKTLKIIAESK